MGHTYRELFPKEANEQDRLIKRKHYIFNQMEDVPLEKLTVGELFFYLNLHFSHYHETNHDDLDVLEDILEKIKYRNKEDL